MIRDERKGGRKEMKEFFNTLKVGDIVLVVLLLLISLIPLAIFSWQQAQIDGGRLVAVVSLENEVLHEISLSEHENHEAFDVVTHDHEVNTIELTDQGIRINRATCNDQVCVRTGFISKAGQTIICLPHQLVIEIQNIGNDNIDQDQVDIISS